MDNVIEGLKQVIAEMERDRTEMLELYRKIARLEDERDAAVEVALSFVPGRNRKEAGRQLRDEIAAKLAEKAKSD